MRRRRRRGTGGIIALANGTFTARVSLGVRDGKRIRVERKGFRSRAEAEVALGSMRGAADLDDRTPLGMYLAAWLEGAKPSLAIRSQRAYAADIRLHIAPSLGAVAIGRLTPRHVRDLIAERTRAGVAPARIRRVVTVLGLALGQGVRDGSLARNVAAGHRIRQAEPEPFVMSPELARRVLVAIKGDRFEAAWIAAMMTGLRRGELLGLRWADVDLEGGSLTVRRQRGVAGIAAPKTSAARRTIPLPTLVIVALKAHRGARVPRPDEPIWDVGPSTLTHAWGRTVVRTKLPPMRLHDLRHAAATLMLATGTPMRVIADTLGHSSPAITARIYAHVLPAAQRESADRLDDELRQGS